MPLVVTGSQFERSGCQLIPIDEDGDWNDIGPPEASDRFYNLVDIVADEFEMWGARFDQGYFEYHYWLPYTSFMIDTLPVTAPTQHERIESFIELKRWLLSVDISEDDAELLLADKLPKAWLAQQEKIKW